jgi:hypothetical protein
MTITAVCLVLGALLAVVVGQAVLANGQVRLSSLSEELSLAQAAHRQSELSVAQLETPSRIVAAATTQLHMLHPDTVTELPYVSLTVPLPTPKVMPAPAPAPAPATTGATTAAASTTGTTAPSSTTPTSTP